VQKSHTCYSDKDVVSVFARGESVIVQEDDGQGGKIDRQVTKKIPLKGLKELNGPGGITFAGGHELRSDAFISGAVSPGATVTLKPADGASVILGRAASTPSNGTTTAPCFTFSGPVAAVDPASSKIIFLGFVDKSGRLSGPAWFRFLSVIDDLHVGLLYINDIGASAMEGPFSGLAKSSQPSLFR